MEIHVPDKGFIIRGLSKNVIATVLQKARSLQLIMNFIFRVFQSEHFPFLGVNNTGTTMNDMRCRTTFYTALGRLLLVELGEDEERFDRFMLPLTGKCKYSCCFFLT